MSRWKRWRPVMVVAVIVLAYPTVAVAKEAVSDVFVTNTPANPVPAAIVGTPTVNVGNSPQVHVAGTPTVNVGNSPEVQIAGTPTVQISGPVGVNDGRREVSAYFLSRASNQNTINELQLLNLQEIPEQGQRLVVERISVFVNGASRLEDQVVTLGVLSGVGRVPYWRLELDAAGSATADIGGVAIPSPPADSTAFNQEHRPIDDLYIEWDEVIHDNPQTSLIAVLVTGHLVPA